MRKPRAKEDVVVKLRAHIDAAEVMSQILEHPAYAGFFNGLEAEITEKMLSAPVADDDARRNAAIELQILKKFRAHLTEVARRGDRAKAKLDELEDKADSAS